MTAIQIRNVPDATVDALRVRAASQGMSLSGFLRDQLERLAVHPGNAAVIKRVASRRRPQDVTVDEIVDEIRALRDKS
jgi:plasmid stability protein